MLWLVDSQTYYPIIYLKETRKPSVRKAQLLNENQTKDCAHMWQIFWSKLVNLPLS